mmetsp:Transcript_77411/g.129187  ORF Transcript_77411/g.129187 Transcript_77411/m.129187 type:complete len:255 (-) Transcript_77411:199-963(-)
MWQTYGELHSHKSNPSLLACFPAGLTCETNPLAVCHMACSCPGQRATLILRFLLWLLCCSLHACSGFSANLIGRWPSPQSSAPPASRPRAPSPPRKIICSLQTIKSWPFSYSRHDFSAHPRSMGHGQRSIAQLLTALRGVLGQACVRPGADSGSAKGKKRRHRGVDGRGVCHQADLDGDGRDLLIHSEENATSPGGTTATPPCLLKGHTNVEHVTGGAPPSSHLWFAFIVPAPACHPPKTQGGTLVTIKTALRG